MRRYLIKLPTSLLLIILVLPHGALASGIDTASYWIKGLPSPDEVVLGSDEIKEFNRITLDGNDQMAELNSMPEFIPDWQLFDWLLYDRIPYEEVMGRRYFSNGRRVPGKFLDGLAHNMNLDGVAGENTVAYGVVVERADVRAFPTDEPMLKRPGRLEFDTVQYSSVYPTDAVALLHTSRDGQWGFFQTATVRGWIKMSKVAFGDKEAAVERGDDFLVVTGSAVKVYKDKKLSKVSSAVPMGALLYLSGLKDESKNSYTIKFPERAPDGGLSWTDGYIRKDADVSRGFLPYTGRNVITQAFKMLGEEYGWGGKDGKRDCSEFIKDLFSTMGIMLPRNSRYQGVSGDVLAYRDGPDSTDIIEALKSARPGITLLGLDRHIMLYLGSIKGKPYAIHQVFGYKDGSRFKILNRVTVTDLELGRRSKAGPLKKRIRSVTEIRIPDSES